MTDHARDHGDRHGPGGPDPIPGGTGGDTLWELLDDGFGDTILRPTLGSTINDPAVYDAFVVQTYGSVVDDSDVIDWDWGFLGYGDIILNGGGQVVLWSGDDQGWSNSDITVGTSWGDIDIFAAYQIEIYTIDPDDFTVVDIIINSSSTDGPGSVWVFHDGNFQVDSSEWMWIGARGQDVDGASIRLLPRAYGGTGYLNIEGLPTSDPGGTNRVWSSGGLLALSGATNPTGPWTAVVKSADETVNNSTTLQDDDHLFFTASSGVAYEIEIVLLYDDSTGGTPDLKVAAGEDSTARGALIQLGLNISDTAASASARTNLSDVFTTGTSTTRRVVKASGVHMGAGGSFKIQWAQQTANSSNTIVRQGSFLRYRALT